MTVEAAAPVSLDDFGDVLTDRDLARLLQVNEEWAVQRRYRAHQRGVKADLPAVIAALLPGKIRYRKLDVAEWLKTGRSSAAHSLRRSA